jgi:hypothetical protein
MPFTPTADLPPNPSVRIFFSGLLLLEPSEDEKTCEVFVNRSAPDHHLTIEVRRKEAGKPDIIMMRHVGPLAFGITPQAVAPTNGFSIQVGPDPKGVRKYEPATPPQGSEPKGLNLAINLEDAQFHNGNADVGVGVPGGPNPKLLDVDPLGGRPSIILNDAIFYTAATTDENIIVTLKKNGNLIGTLTPFASLIGANIYLDDDSSVFVSWRQQGRDEVLELAKPKPEENHSYEIYIVNDPLYESDESLLPAHDEFKEYYKILPNVKTEEQFRVNFATQHPNSPFPGRGSSRAPCMSIIKSA